MSRAQSVRVKVLALQSELNIKEEAESIFNWILDAFESNKDIAKAGKAIAFMPYDSSEISLGDDLPAYSTKQQLNKDIILELFKEVKTLVDAEDGFDADIMPNTNLRGKPDQGAWIKVTIS